MKYFRRLGVALITFIVGVAVAPIQFYWDASVRGKVVDGGGNYGVTRFTSSYFVKLWFGCTEYVSPEKANQVFDQRLNEAVKVIEVGPRFDRQGNVTGRRAVALFFSPEFHGHYTVILWTEGRFLRYIYSTSALHAKEFEKQRR